jgi:hypothetical protein
MMSGLAGDSQAEEALKRVPIFIWLLARHKVEERVNAGGRSAEELKGVMPVRSPTSSARRFGSVERWEAESGLSELLRSRVVGRTFSLQTQDSRRRLLPASSRRIGL